MTLTAYTGARIFDGAQWLDRMALLVRDGRIDGYMAANSPSDAIRVPLAGGMLVPGFIDLQVNGGGGVLFNEARTVESIRTICAAHARFGTTGLLPTLITDTPAITAEAVAAGIAASEEGFPGFLGLHLEGPHLSIARKGAHDPALIRPMDDADLAALRAARRQLHTLVVTVAAETVTPAQIAALVEAGIIVSIGHSDASSELTMAAFAAGASMATHLFNAMSQLGNREPGVVGAVLLNGQVSAGLIADGIHVHPETVRAALAAKKGPAKIFLVTDAMALTGTDLTSFSLNGRTIHRVDGALRLDDGTLAGADLTMIDAVAWMHRTIGLDLGEAVRMATLYPAEAIGVSAERGHLGRGAVADFVHITDDLTVSATYIGGARVFGS
ncbi:MAG: N-acetylglucosamine-6-phosphate deacetylase [Devosia sp.]|nr:N-acetylglucosamine-6-phosphate deacetylase [Devosia sp.]